MRSSRFIPNLVHGSQHTAQVYHPTVPFLLRASLLIHAIASRTWSGVGVKEMLRAAALSRSCFWRHSGSSED